MSFTQLLGSVIGIVILTTGAYLIVSPRAREAAQARSDAFAQMRDTYENTPEIKGGYSESYTEYEAESEDEDEEDADRDDDREVTTHNAPAAAAASPKPTPSPTPTTPSPSGYTLAQVAQHADATSCWSAISGKVYNLTSFISEHPGGEKRILKICGKDGSSAFEGQHGGDRKPEQMLAGMYIGTLIH